MTVNGGKARATPTRKWLLPVAAAAWAIAVSGASILVWRYKSEPGEQGQPPPSWPAASRIDRAHKRTTVVVFVHPRCPCTSATLAELRRLSADLGRVSPRIVFFVPPGVDSSWREGGHWSAARDIPGTIVTADDDGAEARIFGAHASGYTVAYAADGMLLFSGGITTARGHVGESPVATRSILGGTSGPPASTPVFGCSLRDPR